MGNGQRLPGGEIRRTPQSASPLQNRLLAHLPKELLNQLKDRLENVSVAIKQILSEQESSIEHVYFPLNCVVSQVTRMSNGDIIEVATLGREGMVGLPVLLGSKRTLLSAFAQVEGKALRMTAEAFRSEVEKGGALQHVLLRYTQAYLIQVAQGGACNQLHPVRQRCARWLLQTHDRVGLDEFTLTHEFLCQMLAVRRATVSEIAASFQHERLIRYHRGRIEVLNRQGLLAASCECYEVIRREYDRALGGR